MPRIDEVGTIMHLKHYPQSFGRHKGNHRCLCEQCHPHPGARADRRTAALAACRQLGLGAFRDVFGVVEAVLLDSGPDRPHLKETIMKGIIAWLLGVPIVVIILLYVTNVF